MAASPVSPSGQRRRSTSTGSSTPSPTNKAWWHSSGGCFAGQPPGGRRTPSSVSRPAPRWSASGAAMWYSGTSPTTTGWQAFVHEGVVTARHGGTGLEMELSPGQWVGAMGGKLDDSGPWMTTRGSRLCQQPESRLTKRFLFPSPLRLQLRLRRPPRPPLHLPQRPALHLRPWPSMSSSFSLL